MKLLNCISIITKARKRVILKVFLLFYIFSTIMFLSDNKVLASIDLYPGQTVVIYPGQTLLDNGCTYYFITPNGQNAIPADTVGTDTLEAGSYGVSGGNHSVPTGQAYYAQERLIDFGMNINWASIESMYVQVWRGNVINIMVSNAPNGPWEVVGNIPTETGSFGQEAGGYNINVGNYSPSVNTSFRYIRVTSDTGNNSSGHVVDIIAITAKTYPALMINCPSQGQIFNSNFIPQITVQDPNGHSLTCYRIIESESSDDPKTVSNTVTAQQVSFSPIDISKLSDGAHPISFKASSDYYSGLSRSTSLTTSFTIDRTGPTISAFSVSSTDTGMTVTGSASDPSGLADQGYRYTVGSTISDWTSSTTYTQSNLTPNTKYTVILEARDIVGNIKSQTQDAYTKAQINTVTVNNITPTTLDISAGDDNPANTQYQIKTGTQYVTQSGTLSSTPQWVTLTNKRITVTGLTPGTSYTFEVKAGNAQNIETGIVSAAGVTLPEAVTNINYTRNITSIGLTWSAAQGGQSYDIERNGSIITNVTGTSFTDSSLTPNTQYRYRIRAKNRVGTGEEGAGAWSAEQVISTKPNPPAAPSNVKAVQTCSSVTVTWDGATAATGYRIKVDGTEIDNGNSTQYIHSPLQAETWHTYQVLAYNEGGPSPWTPVPEIQIQTYPNPPAKIGNVRMTHRTQNEITLEWDRAEKADGYELTVDGMILPDQITGTSYTHTGLVADTEHRYKVRGRNIGGPGEWSDEIKFKTLPNPPAMPTNVSANAGSEEIKIIWDRIMYATGYEVEIDGGAPFDCGEAINYIHKGLSPSQTHTYRVRAYNGGGPSNWSPELKVSTLPDTNLALTNVATLVTTTTITLAWDAVNPDSQYDIEVDGVVMDNGRNTMYNHTELTPNTLHTYRVKTRDTGGGGEWCAVLSISTLPDPPGVPKNVTTYASYDRIDIGWEAVTAATGYDIEVDGVISDNSTGTSFIHENLEPGTQHTYRVRAKNIGGVTAWSPLMKVSTLHRTNNVNNGAGKEFKVAVVASHIQDFQGRSFTLTYNPDQVEVIDLCDQTPEKDVTSGSIPDMGLTVEYTPGQIVFKVNKPIVPGTSWSGVISTVVFESKIDGQAEISYIVK